MLDGTWLSHWHEINQTEEVEDQSLNRNCFPLIVEHSIFFFPLTAAFNKTWSSSVFICSMMLLRYKKFSKLKAHRLLLPIELKQTGCQCFDILQDVFPKGKVKNSRVFSGETLRWTQHYKMFRCYKQSWSPFILGQFAGLLCGSTGVILCPSGAFVVLIEFLFGHILPFL